MDIITIISSPIFIWLAIAVVLAVVEALTMGLTSIWFAGGAFAAAITALIGGSLILQIVIFVAVSVVLLLVTGPIAKRKMNSKGEETNINAIIGTTGVVEESIDWKSPGRINADGKSWRAVLAEGAQPLAEGQQAVIKEVKGVTLIVGEEKND